MTNSTGHQVEIPNCHGVWLLVGLENAHVTAMPGSLSCSTPHGAVFRHGSTRVPLTVDTAYGACTTSSAEASADLPACLHRDGNILPPLVPAGAYHTKVDMPDLDGVRIPAPNSIAVTVTP